MIPELNPVLNILLLSLIASLGTGLGGLIVIIRKPGKRSFGFLMGITAGVMISLSFLELVDKAWELQGFGTATIGFGAGALFMLLLDIALPHIRFGEKEVRGADEAPPVELHHRGRHGFGRMRRGAAAIRRQRPALPQRLQIAQHGPLLPEQPLGLVVFALQAGLFSTGNGVPPMGPSTAPIGIVNNTSVGGALGIASWIRFPNFSKPALLTYL